MTKYYLTGISGVGKSSVVNELNKNGISTFELDEVEGLCYWKHRLTGKEGVYSYGIGREWLEAHEYLCDVEKLKEIFQEHENETLVISGLAANQGKFLDLFDKIILFYCRPEVFLSRLSIRTNNEFGKEKSEQEHILSWYKEFEEEMLNKGAISINTEEPLEIVAKKVIEIIRANP